MLLQNVASVYVESFWYKLIHISTNSSDYVKASQILFKPSIHIYPDCTIQYGTGVLGLVSLTLSKGCRGDAHLFDATGN